MRVMEENTGGELDIHILDNFGIGGFPFILEKQNNVTSLTHAMKMSF